MATTSSFQGKYYYYENINGKEKKLEKNFTDPKKYNEFVKKHPLSLSSFFGIATPKTKAITKKKVVAKKKTTANKKPTKTRKSKK